MTKNASLSSEEASVQAASSRVASRIAQQTLARRGADYTDEVRRLLDAGLDVMRTCGTSSRPRVADIVSAAGLSNDAFYRHFASKDALVAALLEAGTDRLLTYIAHQMDKAATPEDRVRRWVEGILSQAADDDVAATTLAVLWNAGSISALDASGPPSPNQPLASLVLEPFAQLGSADPGLAASLAAHAVVGNLRDHLWQRTRPTTAETGQIAEFCLAAARGPAV